MVARLPGLNDAVIAGPDEFIAVFDGAETLPEPDKVISREDFFARPNYWYYLGGASIPNEWIAAAWEQLPEFRDNVTYQFVREASKVGDIDGLRTSLEFLDQVLPLQRLVEIYERVRERSPLREPEFRPTFEKVFRERMSAFPKPLPQPALEIRHHPYGVPTGRTDDEIPF
jgi:hypothetical protein